MAVQRHVPLKNSYASHLKNRLAPPFNPQRSPSWRDHRWDEVYRANNSPQAASDHAH